LERSSTLDPFTFVISLVAIVTGGRLLARLISRRDYAHREPPRADRVELEALRASVDDVSDRLGRLEEERDFYRALLEAPKADAPGDARGASDL
jgi:hypothetical protein